MSKIRLDKFLAQKYPKFSRSAWQKIIKRGLVLVYPVRKTGFSNGVNQKLAQPNHLLKKNDPIKINWQKIKEKQLEQIIDLSQKSAILLKVIFENKDFLIIEKPAGIAVHPVKIGQKNTLVNAILARYPEISAVGGSASSGKKVGNDSLRPGIVHRLDKDVSGLMIIAKNQDALDYFKKEFQNQRVEKEYLALVHSKPPAESGIISLPIAQVRGSLKRTAITSPRFKKIKKEKGAVTEYQVIRRFALSGFTLLKITTLTGRTHQIRVHLKAIGCPIVGDRHYKLKVKTRKIKINLNRIFLHAVYLGFYDLDEKWREFKSNLPPELDNFLKSIN